MKTHRSLTGIVAFLSLLAFTSPLLGADSSTKKSKANTNESSAARNSAKVDLNTADLATLETLPGVGPQTAKAIVAARPFKSVNELQDVQGIGPARMSDLKDRITVSPVSAKKEATSTKAVTSSKSESARSAPQSSSVTRKVDLNTADAATLETLPGIGAATARAIVSARPFASVDDLERVSGIGPAKIADLRDKVMVSPKASSSSQSSSSTARRPAVESAPSPRSRSVDTERPLEPTGRVDSSRSADSAPRTTSSATSAKVNLNTATLQELEALPEIGPVKGQAIIDARPFAKIDDVMRVTGIKEATFEAIKDQITVR